MILEKIKENIFLTFIVFIYLALFIVSPVMGINSVKNSGYYIKEMIIIMPVIFILTALLDMWVAKEKIMQFLGNDAGYKGIVFAFVVGSISAGPIYAAFPMCVMLHKKGASIRNIIIILSSWAVIKVPMLLNEAKFLGPKFMIIRWILTVIAILLFSWIAEKVVKDEDLPADVREQTGLNINKDACMGCNLCAKSYPELFQMEGKKAIVKDYEEKDMDKERLKEAIDACPVSAISFNTI